ALRRAGGGAGRGRPAAGGRGPRRGASGPEPLRDLLDGAPAAPAALSGELKVVPTQRITADRATHPARPVRRRPFVPWALAVACALASAPGCASWPNPWGVGKARPPGGAGGPVDSRGLRARPPEAQPRPQRGAP